MAHIIEVILLVTPVIGVMLLEYKTSNEQPGVMKPVNQERQHELALVTFTVDATFSGGRL